MLRCCFCILKCYKIEKKIQIMLIEITKRCLRNLKNISDNCWLLQNLQDSLKFYTGKLRGNLVLNCSILVDIFFTFQLLIFKMLIGCGCVRGCKLTQKQMVCNKLLLTNTDIIIMCENNWWHHSYSKTNKQIKIWKKSNHNFWGILHQSGFPDWI